MLRVSRHGTDAHQISLASGGRAATLWEPTGVLQGIPDTARAGPDVSVRRDTPALLVVCSAGSTELSLLSTSDARC